jgi:hypothetical protein
MGAKGYLQHLGSMKNWKPLMWHPSLCLAGNLEVCRKVNAGKLWGTVDRRLLERRSVVEDVHLHAVASGCLYEPGPWPPAKSHNC